MGKSVGLVRWNSFPCGASGNCLPNKIPFPHYEVKKKKDFSYMLSV